MSLFLLDLPSAEYPPAPRNFSLQSHDATREAWPPHDSRKSPSELSFSCSEGVRSDRVAESERERFLVVEVEVWLGEFEWALRAEVGVGVGWGGETAA